MQEHKLDVPARQETGYIIVEKTVNALEIHLSGAPLDLFDYVQAAVYDELVHVPGLLEEARLTVAAGFGGSELVLEERVVLRPDYDEVIGHFCRLISRWVGRWVGRSFVITGLIYLSSRLLHFIGNEGVFDRRSRFVSGVAVRGSVTDGLVTYLELSCCPICPSFTEGRSSDSVMGAKLILSAWYRLRSVERIGSCSSRELRAISKKLPPGLMQRFTLGTPCGGTVPTPLCKEDPMATLEIPEGAATSASTGCRHGRGDG